MYKQEDYLKDQVAIYRGIAKLRCSTVWCIGVIYAKQRKENINLYQNRLAIAGGHCTWHVLENSLKSHLHYRKKLDPDALKSCPDQYFLTVYIGNNQVRLIIKKCNSTHARNHGKAWQVHMKKMVQNEDVFTQLFGTSKGVQTNFFFAVLLP